MIGKPSRDCLVLAHLNTHGRWVASQFMYDDLCRTYSAKQVHRLFRELAKKGWVDHAEPKKSKLTTIGEQALSFGTLTRRPWRSIS